jgi:hypothetical protein
VRNQRDGGKSRVRETEVATGGIESSFAEDQVVRNSQRNKTRGAFYRLFALAEGLCFGGVEPTRVRPVGDISINGAVT